MKLILFLGFRNLFRQKRRTILLSTAIGFGMMILVITSSFSHGISDNIFNRVLVYSNGHMELSMVEKSKINTPYIRDKDRFIKLIRDNLTDIDRISEAVSVMGRVVGNRNSRIMVLVGIPFDNAGTRNYFKQSIVEGNMENFINGAMENPTLFTDDMIKKLGVKLGDSVKMSLTTTTGQVQSARLTVAAVMRSNNIMNFVTYTNLNTLKSIRGMRPYETGSLQVVFRKVNDPKFVVIQAEKIYKLLEPNIAEIYGNASKKQSIENATALGFFNSEKEMSLLKKNIKILKGNLPDEKLEKKAMISAGLAEKLKIKPGDSFTYAYKTKFETQTIENNYTVSGIFESDKIPAGKNIVLLNENEFYRTYLENLPVQADESKGAYVPKKAEVLYSAFSPEWQLLPRTHDSESLQKKLRDLQKTKWQGPSLDVRTMYETASMVLTLENALNMIAFVAVLILFFIILIGVLNTLRMTIRERTREIGTIRAIGMQSKDVRNLFITETLLLSLLASIMGIIAGLILMYLSRLITINTGSIFSMLLVDKHLYFVPNIGSITGYTIFILILSGLTAFFPARHAAKLSAAVALRHYE